MSCARHAYSFATFNFGPPFDPPRRILNCNQFGVTENALARSPGEPARCNECVREKGHAAAAATAAESDKRSTRIENNALMVSL